MSGEQVGLNTYAYAYGVRRTRTPIVVVVYVVHICILRIHLGLCWPDEHIIWITFGSFIKQLN